MGQTELVWPLEAWEYLPLLMQFGVFWDDLGLSNSFKCINVKSKGRGKFTTIFHIFHVISLAIKDLRG